MLQDKLHVFVARDVEDVITPTVLSDIQLQWRKSLVLKGRLLFYINFVSQQGLEFL